MKAAAGAAKDGPRGWKRWGEAEARRTLAAQAASGLGIPEYARREGLNPERLYRWQRAIKPTAPKVAGAPILPSPTVRESALRFIPAGVLVSAPGAGPAVMVRVPGGAAIEVASPESTPVTWLAALIQALSGDAP